MTKKVEASAHEVEQTATKSPAKKVTVEAKQKKDAPVTKSKVANRSYATGKRKTSIARVWIESGKGKITVNGRSFESYFARPTLQMIINQPFEVANRSGLFDVKCTVVGGGLSGQAGAVKHGISKALLAFDPEVKAPLREGGFLTRDSRIVERKKYGRAKARRRFQFSKR